MPIIDVHVHIMPDPNRRFDASIDDALDMMGRFGVARMVAMSPPRPKPGNRGFDYEDLHGALARHPGRFSFLAGGGSLNHTIHRVDPDEVTPKIRADFVGAARAAISDGAKGFGEMGSLHISAAPKHVYSYVPADHPLLLALADVAAEKNVPIDLHMDAVTAEMATPSDLAQFPNNPSRLPATIGSLERLLAHNRGAPIVWAHGGSDRLGGMTAELVGALMDRHSNLYVSLRPIGLTARVLKNKLLAGPPLQIDPDWLPVLTRHSDRFVIGAEGFYGGPIAAFSRTTEFRLRATVEFLTLLPIDIARKIGFENAVRIYKLPEPVAVPATQNAPAVRKGPPKDGLCRDGNMAHCRKMCDRGVAPACNRLKRGK